MLNIVLFGAPGCGKGTQSELLEEKYGLHHISTGSLIRAEIASETPVGLEMKSRIEKGELAPDQLVVDMVHNYVREHTSEAKGTIFDGFPRTTPQAEIFDKILSEYNEKVDLMIYMDVPEDELVTRILLRGKSSGRADDQSEEIIRNRIRVYNSQTAVVADYYKKQGKYESVNSHGSVEEVFERIRKVIDSRL